MSRRSTLSVLGALALVVASVAGASSASALASDATAPPQSFGSVPVYGSVQKDVVVTASGGPVTFGAVPTIEAVNGATDQADDYRVQSRTCVDVIAAGTTCTVTVTFNPVAAGLRRANLSIKTLAPAAAVLVSLSGTGVPDATGTYYGLATPTRFLDTRDNQGPPLAGGSTTPVQITGRADIPASGVSAVVFTLTAVTTTRSGFFTAYPSDKPRPVASSINFPANWTGANMVTVPVGANGMVNLYNKGGAAHAVIDVQGWYAEDDTVRLAKGMGAQFRSTRSGDADRIYDSRDDPANNNLPFFSGEYVELTDTWSTTSEATAVKAYAITVHAVEGTGNGVLTAWAGGAVPKPLAATVLYQKGVVATNMAIVPAGHFDPANPSFFEPDQTGFRIINISGTVHMVVEVNGYYVADDSAGMRFRPITSVAAPVRILDTRTATGLSGAFGASQTRTAPATSVGSVDSVFVVGNLTGVSPTKSTFLTLWSGDNARPGSSNLNVGIGAIRAVSTYVPLALNDATLALTYNVFNKAGSMDVVFDAAGTLDRYPGQSVAAAPPASADGAASHPADRTLNGRTISKADHVAGSLQGTTARRG